ncbi:UPF0481 protein At3g47200-like [Primulina tabacum]|uniref:UPF0481 protein At3g47200-like n=1 Tax=Primulina tabacum TaxID=48773 RepID=UPI003F59315C
MRKIADNLELTPLVKGRGNPVRKILRCPTKGKEPVSSFHQPNEEPRSGHREPSNESIPRFSFGPLYGAGHESAEATKERAWEHVEKSSSERDLSVLREIYSGAIRKVEKEAKLTYAGKTSGTASDFRWMMIKDGCFFLQLALLILGTRSDHLGYPSNDPIFGSEQKKKDVKMWIESMFFVGNQIPLVVLKELMNQEFFQKVVAKEKYDPFPSSLCKKVLYELLVSPSLKKGSLVQRLAGRNNSCEDHHPSDILHGLQNLVIGPEPPSSLPNDYEADDDIDLEANEEDINIGEETITRGDAGRIRVLLNTIGLVPSATNNQKRVFPSATELEQAGIHIKKLKSGGVRSIHFRSYYFWANLYMPAFSVDDHTEIIFRNLKTYETGQQLGKQNLVCSYLKVMSDLIQTTRDVKLLNNKDIIEGSSRDKEKLPRMLSRLSSEARDLTTEFQILRRKITDYSSPWIHYKSVINLVVLLTLLQTILALLSYFKPPTTK